MNRTFVFTVISATIIAGISGVGLVRSQDVPKIPNQTDANGAGSRSPRTPLGVIVDEGSALPAASPIAIPASEQPPVANPNKSLDSRGYRPPTAINPEGFAPRLTYQLESEVQVLPDGSEQTYYKYQPITVYSAVVEASDETMKAIIREEIELASKVRDLVAKLNQVKTDIDRSVLEKELRDSLETQFELQQRRRQHEIGQIENRLKKLKSSVELRTTSKATIVDRRFLYLTTGHDPLAWDDGPQPQPPIATQPIYRLPPEFRPTRPDQESNERHPVTLRP